MNAKELVKLSNKVRNIMEESDSVKISVVVFQHSDGDAEVSVNVIADEVKEEIEITEEYIMWTKAMKMAEKVLYSLKVDLKWDIEDHADATLEQNVRHELFNA